MESRAMIFTQHGEPVEIIGGPFLDLLDPSTMDLPLYEIRSLNDASWIRKVRLFQLKADGGAQEIEAATPRGD
jgi:hypothetical protein